MQNRAKPSNLRYQQWNMGEIWAQKLFMRGSSNWLKLDVIQKVDETLRLHYMQFKQFWVSSESDTIFISQKIQYADESGLETTVFPIISIPNSRKPETEQFERFNVIIGGWVLRALGKNKTLVNLFFKVQYSRSEIPEWLASTNFKSVISMIRFLETSCTQKVCSYQAWDEDLWEW